MSMSLSTGLVSGLDYESIINSLIELDSGSVSVMQNRVTSIQNEQVAYSSITAQLLSLKSLTESLSLPTLFKAFSTSSSGSDVMTASAGSDAIPGSYRFSVRSLVTNHQLISKGFSNADTVPVGAGTMSFEVGNGRVNPATSLDDLNGGAGVQRGKIEITDRAGNKAVLDLGTALTVDDVLDAINNETSLNVKASIAGDRIQIRDTTVIGEGDAAQVLTINNVGNGSTATDLGLATYDGDGDGVILSEDVNNLSDSTRLGMLNDGNGVRRAASGDDFTISVEGGESFGVSLDGFLNGTTRLEQLNNGNGVGLGVVRLTDRSGKTADVDLTGSKTVQDVLDQLNDADVELDFSMVSSHLMVRDTTGLDSDDVNAVEMSIEDVSGRAANDLGLAITTDKTSHSGNDIYRIDTIGDVIRAINYADGNIDSDGESTFFTASLSEDGNGIQIQYNRLGGGGITVEAVELDGVSSQAAADLGIEGTWETNRIESRALIAGLDTVLLRSLNGGTGIETGTFRITARDGTTMEYDASDAESLQDIIDLINDNNGDPDNARVEAQVNAAGNGINIVDKTGLDGGWLSIEDISGSTASGLGISGETNSESIEGGNLQLQYVSEATLLDDLNYGEGISDGSFEITNSLGSTARVVISSNLSTLGEVINAINNSAEAIGVSAAINDTGDGIVLRDSTEGDLPLTVTDDSGTVAADLRIAGEAETGSNEIDGSYELTVQIDADDTLNDVMDKINDLGGQVSASILNDGSTQNPYRLSITSGVSGRQGELVFDDGGNGLGVETFVEARDAVIYLGGDDSDRPIVISSSSNTLTDVIPGVTLNLHNTSDEPVNLSVSQDVESVIDTINSFVANFNAIQDTIADYTSYDQETEERGVLLGDSTVTTIQTRLYRELMAFNTSSGTIDRISDIGLKLSDGATLTFDEEAFREAYANDPEGVAAFVNDEDNGLAQRLNKLVEGLTDTDEGLLTKRDETLQSKIDDYNQRIEDMQTLLEKRRARYVQEFAALEAALSDMQDQQSSLSSLASLAS